MHQYEPKSRLCNVIPIVIPIPNASKDEAATGRVRIRQSFIARTRVSETNSQAGRGLQTLLATDVGETKLVAG